MRLRKESRDKAQVALETTMNVELKEARIRLRLWVCSDSWLAVADASIKGSKNLLVTGASSFSD
jgi:hypothetical protein